MSGDVHVRFCERLRVRLPQATHPSLRPNFSMAEWREKGVVPQ